MGANVTFQITVTGTAPLSYQWHFNETEISGATNRTLILTNVQLSAAGGYVIVVTNATGATNSRLANIEVDATFMKITMGSIVTNVATSWGAAWASFAKIHALPILKMRVVRSRIVEKKSESERSVFGHDRASGFGGHQNGHQLSTTEYTRAR